MSVLLYIMIYLRVWKAITRKQGVPDEMAVKDCALLFIRTRTFRNWRSLWKESLSPNRISADSCFRRQLLMPSRRYAAERCCCIILEKFMTRIIVATVITVFIRKKRKKQKINC